MTEKKQPETDNQFRSRIAIVAVADDQYNLAIAGPHDLDIIGAKYGLKRGEGIDDQPQREERPKSVPPVNPSVDGWFPTVHNRYVRRLIPASANGILGNGYRFVHQQGWMMYDRPRDKFITEWRDVPLEEE